MTFTDSFWKWFDKSKVIDKHAGPRLVYHGTTKRFRRFRVPRSDDGEDGVFFTSSKRVATEFSKYRDGKGRIIEAYLQIERPLEYWMDGEEKAPGMIASFIEEAERRNRDGIVLYDIVDGFNGIRADLFVVFKSSQIMVVE